MFDLFKVVINIDNNRICSQGRGFVSKQIFEKLRKIKPVVHHFQRRIAERDMEKILQMRGQKNQIKKKLFREYSNIQSS